MFGGGQGLGLPAGYYPVILLLALAVGPPVIAGGIVGFAAFGMVYVLLGPVERAAERRKEEADKVRRGYIASLIRQPVPVEQARELLDREIIPGLRSLRIDIEQPSWTDDLSPLHLAAEARNMAMIQAIAERRPIRLTGQNDGKTYFVDAAPSDKKLEALAAFIRGLSLFIEKTMEPGDLPFADAERAGLSNHISQMMDSARSLGTNGPRAITIDIEALKSGPISAARAVRGMEAFNEGHYAQAIDLLSAAIQLDRTYARAFLLRGRAQAGHDDHEQAINDFTEAARLMPTLAEPVMRRGDSYERLGKLEEAFADYDEAIRIDPRYTDAYINRGAAYFNNGKNAYLAMDDFRRALEFDPANQTASNNIVAVLKASQADDQSVMSLTEAVSANPESADHRSARAVAYRIRGETAKAMEDLSEAILIAPGHVASRAQRGHMLMTSGLHDQALADYKELEHLLPGQAEIPSTIGWLLEQLGRGAEAVESYRAALIILIRKKSARGARCPVWAPRSARYLENELSTLYGAPTALKR